MEPNDRILAALDTTDVGTAAGWATALQGRVGGIKLGKEFFTANGPDGVRRVTQGTGGGQPLFLDLKFHDIPNTVAGAIGSALKVKPFMLNVHASGGRAMMEAAAAAVAEAGTERPILLGVTVITSLGDGDLADMGINGTAEQQVIRLAQLAQAAGLDGVVCSAKEITAIREACGPAFKLVTPGIRPAWASSDDQKRIVTPADAVAMGADYLVIGRPITGADDPAEAAARIGAELAGT
ncbi:MAG: orotidine-5'-phosphate decarboxylase [Magnetovibrio sp.]|nr:orotidine-5'-phosphate decarboxylase [Magnetovibrio sp.]